MVKPSINPLITALAVHVLPTAQLTSCPSAWADRQLISFISIMPMRPAESQLCRDLAAVRNAAVHPSWRMRPDPEACCNDPRGPCARPGSLVGVPTVRSSSLNVCDGVLIKRGFGKRTPHQDGKTGLSAALHYYSLGTGGQAGPLQWRVCAVLFRTVAIMFVSTAV